MSEPVKDGAVNLQECPVWHDLQAVEAHGQDLVRALRNLKREMKRCRKCRGADSCPLIAQFQGLVDAVVDELNREWGWK